MTSYQVYDKLMYGLNYHILIDLLNSTVKIHLLYNLL
jgi:hypothetical protein